MRHASRDDFFQSGYLQRSSYVYYTYYCAHIKNANGCENGMNVCMNGSLLLLLAKTTKRIQMKNGTQII